MDLVNAIVVYFALGVPFVMLSVYLRSTLLEPTDVFRVIYHLAFWPGIVLVRSVSAAGNFHRPPKSHRSDFRFGMSAIEGTSDARRTLRRRLEAKQTILNGLFVAHQTAFTASELRLPFDDCIQHPNPKLGAKCFQRKNVAKIERAITEAQNDISKSLAEFKLSERATQVSLEPNNVERPVRDLC